ncbi:DUF1796 family putative cysteine peptidase [Janthinobacterium sp. 17J80-10]|uniref:DUF1796 family putative cysteine peptidase n=1 Tax=Janthinobacterium sp. 17J80-10 TaxID=2497863 RepID=UPI0010056788|nr:DUF1796 family putative cysteine peptidase [Janthinobacterium sp. 17J80-10]QAU35544.1 hypothetical protein EKL02_15995 [Janthinobacterium sp. 17J80-10]
MKKTDLIFSLGPNCKNAWNIRDYFKVDRAYPFDWWITPAKSMLKMIESGFEFDVKRDDLHITPTNEHNTVYNYKLNLLHHHDFTRVWGEHPGVVFEVSDDEIEKVNSKYRHLFKRLADDLAQAAHPIAVLNWSYSGWPNEYKGIPTNAALNGFMPPDQLAREIRDRLGKKLRIAFIAIGEPLHEEHEWGCIVRRPDLGERENIKGADYAEPIHVFRQAYDMLNFSLDDDSLQASR